MPFGEDALGRQVLLVRGILLLFLLLFGCLLLLADLLLDVEEAEGGESFLIALDPLQAEAFVGGESVAVVIIALFFIR